MRTRWGLLGLVLLAGSAFGAEKAYVTAPSNEIIQVDFDARTTKTVVRDRGKNFEGLAVRRDGPDQFKLVVANLTFGSDLRIYDPVTGSGSRITRFRGAHGVALSPYGHLFSLGGVWAWSQVAFVPRRTACDATPQPSGCSPGGYGPLQLIDEKVRVGGRFVHWLSDLRVANTTGGGLLEPGELAVLVTSPPMVIAYTPEEDSWHCAPDCEPRVVVPESELKGHILTGIEIASDSILISTAKGAILKAKKGTGGPEVSPFVFLPGKGVKLSVGVESGTEVVYATVATKKGSLHRFDVETGTPLGNEITTGIKVPHGVGNESSSIVLTAAGSNVKINLPTMQAVFDEVLQSGSTDAQCNLYPAPSDLPRDVRLSELGIALEPGTDVVIPAHIEPFRVGNPTTGALSYY
ncbi:MAG: hypothetical protein ACRD21_14070, partial [Vicinamibacteria bacterium]